MQLVYSAAPTKFDGVMTNVLKTDIVVYKFELVSPLTFIFRYISQGKVMNNFIPPGFSEFFFYYFLIFPYYAGFGIG